MSIGKKVLVWLSWWVDSAVSAALFLQQWYEVVWWFMKNYVSDKWNCTTFKDAEEAIKVAKFLWIELLSFDLQKEYQERIIDYIFEWYSKWITPNPDVLCNNLIKFDVFLNKAVEQWFDYIATGHYARITSSVISNECEKSIGVSVSSWTNVKDLRWNTKDSSFHSEWQAWWEVDSSLRSEWQIRYHLLQWVDSWKDQSYFLSGLNQYQLSKSIFPLWEMTKQEVREKAKEIWLPNAERRDSQGLCFIWNVPIRNFLMQKFSKKEWDILDLNGKKVWTHQWAYFYTIGQKQWLWLNFKAYVYRIDIENNILYVTDKDADELKTKTLIAKNWHWICPDMESELLNWDKNLSGKIRYRQIPAVECSLEKMENWDMKVTFEKEQWAVAPGQVFVAYDGDECLGNWMIA